MLPFTRATHFGVALSLSTAMLRGRQAESCQVPVSCRELMRSFGWDTADAFMQHDAQEGEQRERAGRSRMVHSWIAGKGGTRRTLAFSLVHFAKGCYFNFLPTNGFSVLNH